MHNEFPKAFDIDIKEFADMFNIEVRGLYTDIKDSITKRFFRRETTLDVGDGEKKLCHWLDSLTYHNGKARLKLEFSNNIIPLLTQLKNKFTSYHIEQISLMKSIYAIRIYEYCILEINRLQTNLCEFTIEVLILKKRLELENKYSKYHNFKIHVLNRAKQEINKHSDLTIDFEEIKKGRSVESIKFIIQRKKGTKPAKYVKEKQQELDFDTTGDEGLNTDTSPLSDTELHYLMRKNDIKGRMFSYRVAEKVACKLIKDYDFERIEKALNYMDNAINKGKDIKNKPAYLVNAIKEGY